jgi:hypothetical protein
MIGSTILNFFHLNVKDVVKDFMERINYWNTLFFTLENQHSGVFIYLMN